MSGMQSFYSGQAAKWLRALLSLTIIVLAIVKGMWPLAIIGLAFLLSAFTGTCPIRLRSGKKSAAPDQDQGDQSR